LLYWGVQAANVMTIGVYDVEMLEYAGIGVAMGNRQQTVG